MILKKSKGFILIASYMIIVVFIILGVAFLSKSVSEKRIAERERNFVQSLYLAEAGIDYGLTELREGSSPGNNSDALSGIGSYSCTWNLVSGETAKWEVISTGTVGDSNRTLRVELQEDTFARYLYFTDDEHFRWFGWRIPVWFITGDYLGGPLQTNSHLHISGNPVFADPNSHKPVKAEDNFITYMNGGSPIDSSASSNPPNDNPDFQDGIQLGAPEAPFPSKALVLRTEAVQEGYHFNASGAEPAQIVLNSDGTMTVTDSTHTNEIMPLPANGAVFVTGGNVEVFGTLNGQLSIGTNRNIVITDDIIYNNDPRVDPLSTDTLGLIAERDVVISKDVPYHDYNGDSLGDLKIDVSTMALGNSFTVEEWWVGPAKGTLMVYGGIIQDYRGPVGTFNSNTNTKLSGYSKDYQYDPRLLENPPPFYPTTGDYVVLTWEEQ